MPICKNCKSRIDKFNKDRCPICGAEHPFEGVTSDTIEITTSLDVDSLDFKPRKKLNFLLFSIFLGFFGVNYFYAYKRKTGVILLLFNLAMIGLGGGLLGKFSSLGYAVSFVIFICICLLINAGIGIIVFLKPNVKDGHGEFII